jgi:hypothetical protein
MKRFLLLVFIISIAFPAWADTHWVDDNGAAASWAACQSESPLSGASACTLAQAFANAVAGDTVYLRGGTYASQGDKVAANSGSAGNKITLSGYLTETVTITGNVAFDFSDRNYWVIQKINFTGITTNATGYDGVVNLINSTYCEVRNCLFDAANGDGRESAIWGVAGGYHVIDSCTFQHWGSITTPDSTIMVVALPYTGGMGTPSDYNVVSNCTFTDWASYGLGFYPGRYNQVINCTFDQSSGGYGLGITIGANGTVAHHNLIDGCTFIGFGAEHIVMGKAPLQLYGNNNSVRRSIFRNLVNDGSTYHPASIEMGSGASTLSGNYVYNNVFYQNGAEAIGLGNNNVSGNYFYNNIFYGNHTGVNDADGGQHGTTILNWQGGMVGDNTVDYNFFLHDTGSTCADIAANNVFTSSGPNGRTLVWAMANDGTHVLSNNFCDASGPNFVDPDVTHDFHLAAGSPCIGAGTTVNDTNASTGGWSQIGITDIGAFQYSSSPAKVQGVTILGGSLQ